MTLGLPETDRAAFLEGECRSDRSLRAEVESLLANACDATTISMPTRLAAAVTDPLIGRALGHYHIKRTLGAGGMGTVYQAMQEQPRRVVALKVMKRGIASRSALRRFEYEAQILARLRHPGIAQIYEAGVHEDESGESVPFFAMEYIPAAMPITRYAQAKKLGTRGRLDLFAKVCDAVQHGHGKGIIHRDLKPSNILVDPSGNPKIIDFGVARSTDSDLVVTTLQTDIGQLIGTVQYMSPEQCLADPTDLDTRSDVYALGVVLYELLCDQPPYDVSKAAVFEATRIIQESTPARPSKINKTLGGDVETVVMKALEKDRDRRYRSAAEFGGDLRHYLNDEPISAQPPSLAYQVRMFAKKNKIAFRALVAIVLALVIGVLAATTGMVYGWTQYGRAESALVDKQAALAAKELEAERANAAALAEGQARREAEAYARELERQVYLANLRAADASLSANEIALTQRRLDACPKSLRGWEWRHLLALGDRSLAVLRGHQGGVLAASYSPDGSRVVTASDDDTARIWDATSGDEVAALRGHEKWLASAAFSPDGSRVVTASADHTARIWDATSGDELTVLLGHEDIVDSAAFSPDGSRVVTASMDTTARVWDAATGEQITLLRGHEGSLLSASWSPDGSRVVTGSYDNTARIWDAATGENLAILRGHQEWIASAAFSPDGSRVVTASPDKTARIWETLTGKQIIALRGHEAGVLAAAYSPDGSRLVTASDDNTARVWDAESGNQLAALSTHEGPVLSASFSPDGSRVVTASRDKTVRTWDATTGGQLATLRGHENSVDSASFSPDGSRILSASMDTTARLWDAGAGEETAALRAHKDRVSSAQFSPDNSRIVTASWDKTARVWDADTGQQVVALRGHQEWVASASFSPDGSRVVTASPDKTARIWDANTGETIALLRGHEGWVLSAAFSPDGARVVTASDDRTARTWDALTGEEITALRAHEGAVVSASFSPDGARIVTASRDQTVRIWDANTGEEITALRGHEGWVLSAAFSPDGARIVTASMDRTARVWDAATGEQVTALRGHEERVSSAAFSPDGSRVVTASRDKTVRIWDAHTGEEITTLRAHEGWVLSAAFSPDGARLVTASEDGTARIWDSVPYRTRFIQQLSQGPDGEAAAETADSLHAALGDWTRVADAIRQDTPITGEVRRRALGITTVRAEEERRAARARQSE